MSTITIKAFAQQIGIEPERLVKQLGDAGVSGKTVDESLTDEEKRTLLDFLRGGTSEATKATPAAGRGKISLKKKTNSEIQQTSKTGIARTVQVQTKKRRTFVKREVLEQEEAVRQEAEQLAQQEQAAQAERERIEAEELANMSKSQQAEVEKARLAQQAAEEAAAKAAEEEAAKAEESKAAVKEGAADKSATAAEKPRSRREVVMPSIIRKASDRKRVSPIVKQAEPKPASPEPAANAKKAEKTKRKPFAGREELHVTKGRGRKRKEKRRLARLLVLLT